MLTIGDFNFKERDNTEEQERKGKANEQKKRVVLIISRVHGGESPASFVCQGTFNLHYLFIIFVQKMR